MIILIGQSLWFKEYAQSWLTDAGFSIRMQNVMPVTTPSNSLLIVDEAMLGDLLPHYRERQYLVVNVRAVSQAVFRMQQGAQMVFKDYPDEWTLLDWVKRNWSADGQATRMVEFA